MENWDYYGVCPCGYKRRAPFKSLFHIHLEVCPKCGKDKDEWSLKVMKWKSNATFWKPSTWGTGEWITRADAR